MPDFPSGDPSEQGPDQRFRRSDRLRSGKDFQRVNRTGQRKSGRHFVIVSAPHREATASAASRSSLGLAVGRRVGNAVHRNYVKRRVRNWFRTVRSEIPINRDFVVIARKGAAERSSSQIADELSGLLR